MRLTKAQQLTLRRKAEQSGESYMALRRRCVLYDREGCIILPWCGMWLGIETDGYAHS